MHSEDQEGSIISLKSSSARVGALIPHAVPAGRRELPHQPIDTNIRGDRRFRPTAHDVVVNEPLTCAFAFAKYVRRPKICDREAKKNRDLLGRERPFGVIAIGEVDES